MTTIINEPDPTYYATVTFAGTALELWRTKWTVKRTRFLRWYAKYDGQSEHDFNSTRADSPVAALGNAILLLPENDAALDKIYGG